jgi:hypothetical protein
MLRAPLAATPAHCRAPPHSASTLGWPLSAGGCVARTARPGAAGAQCFGACVRAAVHGLGWQTCPRRQMRQQREARADRAVHGCSGMPLRLRSLRRVHCDVPEEGRGARPTASLPPARPHGVVCARSPLLPPFPSLPDRVLCSRLRAPPEGRHRFACRGMLSDVVGMAFAVLRRRRSAQAKALAKGRPTSRSPTRFATPRMPSRPRWSLHSPATPACCALSAPPPPSAMAQSVQQSGFGAGLAENVLERLCSVWPVRIGAFARRFVGSRARALPSVPTATGAHGPRAPSRAAPRARARVPVRTALGDSILARLPDLPRCSAIRVAAAVALDWE